MTTHDPQSQERLFSVQRIYTKDVSFESPNAPDVFRGEWTPKHDLNLNTKINQLDETVFEVILAVTVTVTVEDKTAFIVEVQQAGIFSADGFPENELAPLLGAYCPSILFPYAREVVSDLVVKGSFPQLVLQHVNFDVLFAQHQQQAAGQGQDGGAKPSTH